jgi:hypothetical protein
VSRPAAAGASTLWSHPSLKFYKQRSLVCKILLIARKQLTGANITDMKWFVNPYK